MCIFAVNKLQLLALFRWFTYILPVQYEMVVGQHVPTNLRKGIIGGQLTPCFPPPHLGYTNDVLYGCMWSASELENFGILNFYMLKTNFHSIFPLFGAPLSGAQGI